MSFTEEIKDFGGSQNHGQEQSPQSVLLESLYTMS